MPQLKPTRGICLNRNHPLSRGLVGLWLFNEGSGGQVFDLSGNGNTGTLVNDVSWTSGKFGSALDFPGSGDYVDFDVTKFNSNIGCIVACVNPATLTSSGTIFSTSDVANDDNWLQFKIINDGNLCIVSEIANSRDDVRTSETISTNQWTQVAVNTDGSSWKLYINGQSKSLNVIVGSNTGEWFSDVPGRDNARIGILTRTTHLNAFDGVIDYVMIYNRSLSASEIAQVYREPFCMFEEAMRPKLIGGQIVNLAGSSVALSSLSATAKAMRKVGGNVVSTTDVTAILNLFRSLLYIESNWKREALFNGMTANAFKLGTTLSLGWFWVRVAGCSVLYRGSSMGEIDFVNILAVAEQDACEISPPSYISHNSGSTYFYVVRRFNNCGYQECTLAASVKVSIESTGELAKPQPNKVFDSVAELVDGNKIKLVWYYCPLEQKSQPMCFNVYYDGRTGQIDYENPLVIISYKGRKFYSYQSGALEAGRYLFAIRTEDASGKENSSLARLRIQLDPTNPDAIDILSAEGV